MSSNAFDSRQTKSIKFNFLLTKKTEFQRKPKMHKLLPPVKFSLGCPVSSKADFAIKTGDI